MHKHYSCLLHSPLIVSLFPIYCSISPFKLLFELYCIFSNNLQCYNYCNDIQSYSMLIYNDFHTIFRVFFWHTEPTVSTPFCWEISILFQYKSHKKGHFFQRYSGTILASWDQSNFQTIFIGYSHSNFPVVIKGLHKLCFLIIQIRPYAPTVLTPPIFNFFP